MQQAVEEVKPEQPAATELDTVRAELARTRELLDAARREPATPAPAAPPAPRRPDPPRSGVMAGAPADEPATPIALAARKAASTGDRNSLLQYLRLRRVAAD